MTISRKTARYWGDADFNSLADAAEGAQASATGAQTTADGATAAASAAQTAAVNAQATASDAQTAANTAQTAANTAQTAADGALATANAAQTAADGALATANAAQTAANTAQTAAANAQTSATNAATAAANAQTSADNAATSAASAQSVADAASALAHTVQDDVQTRVKVDLTNLPDASVPGAKLLAATVTAREIAAQAITAEKIIAGAVGTEALASLAVTTAILDAAAVTADKIAAGAVTADKIAARVITASSFVAAYGGNLWPNGTSEVAPPANATSDALASAEFAGRDASAALVGSWGRTVRSVAGVGGYGRLTLSMPAIEGQAFRFTASGKLAVLGGTGSYAALSVDWYTAAGTLIHSDGSLTAATVGAWRGLAVEAEAPINTAEARFSLAAYSPDGNQATCYFDNIIILPLGSSPVGTISMFAGAAANAPPGGWRVCDGSAVSRIGFPRLYSLLGTTYGAGDGSTTFNLPDLRGRFPLGAGQGTGLTNRALGASGGEEAHALTTAELASHTHTASQGNHTHIATEDVHSHSLESSTGAVLANINQSNCSGVAGFANSSTGYTYGGGPALVGNAQPAVLVTWESAGAITIGAQGSGTAHNNVPPFLAITFVIKVL